MDPRRVTRTLPPKERAQDLRAALQRYARVLGVPAADVDDLISDTLELCIRKVDRDLAVPMRWFQETFRRLAANQRRRAAAERRALERLGRATSTRAHRPGSPALDGLEALSPKLREAVRLVYEQDLSLADAAAAAGTSVSAMAVRVHRARQHLRDHGRA